MSSIPLPLGYSTLKQDECTDYNMRYCALLDIYIYRYSFEFHQKPIYILLDIQTASVFEVVVGYDVAPKQMPLLD